MQASNTSIPAPPCDATQIGRYRATLGEAGLQELLSATIHTAVDVGAIKKSEFQRVIVDTTVQEKAIAHPVDSRLLEMARRKVVAAAKRCGIVLKQTFAAEGKTLQRQAGGYAHAKQFKRLRRVVKRQRTILGILIRETKRKMSATTDNALALTSLNTWLERAERVRTQQRHDKNKLYALHAPEVECIGKGKARKPYEFGVKVNVLCDPSGSWSTPTDGEFRMYAGGTTKEEVIAGLHAKATIVFQEYCCEKTSKFIAEHGQEVVVLNAPMGVAGTDKFLMEISRLTGKPIPAQLEKERGELVDAMADSQAHLHGKRYAIYGDPDQMIGTAAFLMELGAEPSHVLSTNGGKEWEIKMNELFASSPYGAGCKAYPKRDLWHLRSLLFTEPVDFMIGNTYGKCSDQSSPCSPDLVNRDKNE